MRTQDFRIIFCLALALLGGCAEHDDRLARQQAERHQLKDAEAKEDKAFQAKMAELDRQDSERLNRYDEEHAQLEARQKADD